MRYTDTILVLSQDYELFFQKSGTIEKCLFEPCDALLKFAHARGLKFTFFVDAGMLLAMQRVANEDRNLSGALGKVQRHIESIAKAGHEIGLHVHPHWEDSRWVDGRWEFGGTRYQLREFADDDLMRIVTDYTACLASISGQTISSYRAGDNNLPKPARNRSQSHRAYRQPPAVREPQPAMRSPVSKLAIDGRVAESPQHMRMDSNQALPFQARSGDSTP